MDRASLIGSLAQEFGMAGFSGKISPSNYIEDTKSLECSAIFLDIDTLEKTKNVIDFYEKKISASTDEDKKQHLLHLKVARKCVEEVISQKLKGQDKIWI